MAVVALDLSLTMTTGHCNVPVPRGCQRRADAGGHHTAEDGVYDSVCVLANSMCFVCLLTVCETQIFNYLDVK
jgi:hypothetical protein